MADNFSEILKLFETAGFEDPLQESKRLLHLVFNGSERFEMEGGILKKIDIDMDDLMASRHKGIPIELILGQTNFMDIKFQCTPGTFIPRQETELLCRTALKLIQQWADKPMLVIDMGTGVGNLAVSLAIHAENIQVLASDVSPDAIEVAQHHVRQYELDSRISLFCGNMFESIRADDYAGFIDMIVCNPPYIPSSSLPKMNTEIIENEPLLAFDAGPYGIDFFRKLINESVYYLKNKGLLTFEIGEGQEKLVSRLLEHSGSYEDIRFYKNKLGRDRVVSAVKKTIK